MSSQSRPLEQRIAIITGASQGLGLEIARRYLESGASLMICARNARCLEQARQTLEPLTGAGQSLLAMPADISKADEVSALVEAALARFGRLDILVNNAGVVGPSGLLECNDWSQWLQTLEINLLGAVLLCRAVLPHFKQRGGGKIIQLSGGGASQPLPHLSAYAVSKAAVVRLVETVAEETRAHRIDINALAPGALNTRLLDQFLAAGPQAVGQDFYQRALQQKRDGGVPLARGAALAVFLGSARSDGISGKLISAVWDPWEELPGHRRELQASDLYTLRRITPRDRGLAWGERD